MVKYEKYDLSKFVDFAPRVFGYDPLTRIIASLQDYPYTGTHEYSNLSDAPSFLSLFTTDEEEGVIKIPQKSKHGGTKYTITRAPYPKEGYSIVCTVSRDGTITCKIGNEIANPVCSDILFSLHICKDIRISEPEGLMGYQRARDYDFSGMYHNLIEKHKSRELNLKTFMELRHDIIQVLVAKTFGLNLHLGTKLDLKLYGLHSNQTPDFFEIFGDNALVGDITVTSDSTLGALNKRTKYSKLFDQLELQGKRVLTLFCSFDHFFKNYHIVLREQPIKILEECSDWYYIFGELAMIYEELKGSYPVEISELLEKRYPIVRDKIGENYNFITNNLKHCADEYFIANYFSNNVMEAFEDSKLDMAELPNVYNSLLEDNKNYDIDVKPSHYIPIPIDNAGFETVKGKYSEQQMIINFFSKEVDDEVYQGFASSLRNCFTSYSDVSYRMFNTGQWFENQDELKEKYRSVNRNQSFEDYLREEGYNIPKPGEDKIPYAKMIHLGQQTVKQISVYLDKSGQDYRKKHEVREHKAKTTCLPTVEYKNVENFLNLLTNDTERNWSEDMFSEFGADVPFVENIKEQYSKMAKKDIKQLGSTYCMKYLRYNSLMYEQLIHYSNLSMSKKRYALFNSGIPNIVGCMRCGYRGMAQQVGKPFFFMGFTKSLGFLNCNMFGKLTIVKVTDDLYFYRTGWFRLPTFRIEYFRDQYYSILSSTLCSISRIRNTKISKKIIKGTFALRTLVGLVANQKFMEKLADARYAIMSSFATHTNFSELLTEKFAPPYKSSVEGWLVHRLFDQLPTFRQSVYDTNNIKINTPILDYLDRRFQQSTGGRFNMKAIWSDRMIYSLQDLLDELFLYVHTPKEPSTAFHEEVNAVKTIQKFQNEFDKYTFEEKCGKHENIEKWLLTKPVVGFDKDFLYAASLHYRSVVGFDLNRIEKYIVNEHIGELTSTKSVIPDKERTIKPMDRHQKYRINTHIAIKGKLTKTQEAYIEDHKTKMKKKFQRSTAEVYHGRHKVHDEILSYVMHYRENTVLSNALLFYNDPDSRVLTDICIKAQYGAKREFYVMNMGAKLMARIVENFYKDIAKQSSTEMISVPGDRKLIHMQNMMDRTIKHALKHGNIVSYCNGDCTKWSAAETMEAFHVLTEGICADWDSDFKFVLQAIINRWSDKEIQIPLNLVSKVYPLGPQTDYIMEASQHNYTIKSTQNFLQGVFNYMSSIKADVCNRYTVHLWNKFYNPDLKFSVEYLVHSDDYVFAFSSPNLEMIEKFRSFHKICMKLCGITDSSKKTNVQPIFMEFISLVCFNGSMAYPTIKKTKEVAATLPCESFVGDSDMVCSRTGECVRVGVDYYSAWIFHRIHMSLLRRAYSLHAGGENYIDDALNKPVQLFGQSDMHPIFYFLCKGDPNNLRIFNFTKNAVNLKKLYTLDNYDDTLKSVHASFREPTFIYNNYTSRIADIRKSTGLLVEDAMTFWEENLVYNFVKPRVIEDLEMWLKCMYFKSSFVKAYNRDSRTTRMLRLSMFSKGHCVTYKSDEELQSFYNRLSECKTKVEKNKIIKQEMLTIKDLIHSVETLPEQKVDDRDIQIAILMGDSTADLVYQWMKTCSVYTTQKVNNYNTCATYSPFRATWLNVSQPVDQVICYGVSYNLFLTNFGDSSNISAVMADFNKLKSALPGLFELFTDTKISYATKMKALQIAYNMYSNNLPRFQVCMSSKRHRQNTIDFLVDSFKFSHDPVFISEVTSKIVQVEMNPYTLERHTILGTSRTTSYLRLLCNNLTIAYIYLLTQRKLEEREISRILGYTKIDDFGIYQDVFSYINKYDYESAKLEGLSYPELIMFVFLKKLICNDDNSLQRLCRHKQYYNYKYLKPQIYNPTTRRYEGNMVAHINFENVSGICTITNDRMFVQTDTLNSTKAELCYLISLRLSSQISERDFLMSIVKPTINKHCKNLIARANAFYLVYEDNRLTYAYRQEGSEYYGLPCSYNPKLHIPKTFDKKENYLLSTNFKLLKASVYVDLRKLITLPFKAAKYVHINLKTDFEDFCLFNDLMAFHVLGEVPHEEHNLLELCKYWGERQPLETQIAPKDTRRIDELSIDDLDIVLPTEFMSATGLEDLEQRQESMVTIVDEEELYDLFEDPIPEVIEEQSPFSPMIRNIELIEPSTTALPTPGTLRSLEEKGDVLRRTILKLLTIDTKVLISPFECACVIRTIQKMLSDRENVWVHPLAHLIGAWLEKTVKVVPDYEEVEGYMVRVMGDELRFYQKRRRAAAVCRRLGLKNDDMFFCPTDFSKSKDDEMVEYFAKIPEYEFWQSIGYYDTLPFYQKNDEFKEFLQLYSMEAWTL